MKFTKETLKRALRTFLQTALSYIAVNFVVYDLTDFSAIKQMLLGLIISGISAGIAAVMNLEFTTGSESEE